MYLITAIPVYRNKFQKPMMFFSVKNFSIGSIILVPFLKNEKPAIVLKSDNLRDKKFTYALFKQLSKDFNGDMFPNINEEEDAVESGHLQKLQDFHSFL